MGNTFWYDTRPSWPGTQRGIRQCCAKTRAKTAPGKLLLDPGAGLLPERQQSWLVGVQAGEGGADLRQVIAIGDPYRARRAVRQAGLLGTDIDHAAGGGFQQNLGETLVTRQ